MIIDWHAHVYPPEDAAKPFWRGRCPMTIEHVIELQERSGIDLTVLSNTMSISRSAAETKQDRAALQAQTLATIHRANRYMAEVQDRFAGRWSQSQAVSPVAAMHSCGNSSAQSSRTDCAASSSHRATTVTIPMMTKLCHFSNSFTRLDIPVMLHPPAAAYGEERMRDYRLLSSIGRPGIAALRLAGSLSAAFSRSFLT